MIHPETSRHSYRYQSNLAPLEVASHKTTFELPSVKVLRKKVAIRLKLGVQEEIHFWHYDGRIYFDGVFPFVLVSD
jgi:hypothetical protein